jgi:hypothetical protein
MALLNIAFYIVENKLECWSLPRILKPWACIIKLITAVIYSFRNKLECLSLARISSLV